MGVKDIFTEDKVESIAAILRRNIQQAVIDDEEKVKENRNLFLLLYGIVNALRNRLPLSCSTQEDCFNCLLIKQVDAFLQNQVRRYRYLGFYLAQTNAIPLTEEHKSLLGIATDFVVNGYRVPFRDYQNGIWFDLISLSLANDGNIDEYPDIFYNGFVGKPILCMSLAGINEFNKEWLKYLALFPYRIGVRGTDLPNFYQFLGNLPDSLTLYKVDSDKVMFRKMEPWFDNTTVSYDEDTGEVEAKIKLYGNYCRHDVPHQVFLNQFLAAVENAYPRSKYPELWAGLDSLTSDDLIDSLGSGFFEEDEFGASFTGESNHLALLQALDDSLSGGEFALISGDWPSLNIERDELKKWIGSKLCESLFGFLDSIGMKINKDSSSLTPKVIFGIYGSGNRKVLIPVLAVVGVLAGEVKKHDVTIEIGAVVLPDDKGFWMVNKIALNDSMAYSLLAMDRRHHLGDFSTKFPKYLNLSSFVDVTGYEVDWSDYCVYEEPSWGDEFWVKDKFYLEANVELLDDIENLPDCTVANVAYIYNQDDDKLGIIVQSGDDDVWFKKWPALTHAILARSGNISTLVSYLNSFKLWPKYKDYFAFFEQYYRRGES